MQYKTIDRAAPRFRKTKFETRLVVEDLHKEFVETTGVQMDYKTFRVMYEENMAVIRHFITTERNGVTLPEQMGNIHLAFFKMRKKPVDFIKGMNTGEAPTNHNWETEGLQGKIVWTYQDIKYKPKYYLLYGFTGVRELKQQASNAFINTPELFKKTLYRKGEARKKRILEQYERKYTGSNQPTESAQQGGELGFSPD